MMQTTLGYLVKTNHQTGKRQVCLARKKRGHGADLWNGFGGKFEKGETTLEAFAREAKEELSITPVNPRYTGRVKFEFVDNPEVNQLVHILVCENWEGTPTESDEMIPDWFDIDSLPFEKMWPADKEYVLKALNGDFISLHVVFNKDKSYTHKPYQSDLVDTYSGKEIDLLNLELEDITIEDIAHGLSLTTRWGGQCNEFYSVAQHSVLVSNNLKELELKKIGLLHDASEAYIGDLIRPIKILPELSFFKELEEHIEDLIARRFGLSTLKNPLVKESDNQVYVTEKKFLMKNIKSTAFAHINPLDIVIKPMDSKSAEKLFLDTFNKLFN